MLYHLFVYLDKAYQLPGAGLFYYLSFRSAMAAILSLIISLIIGKKIIQILQRKQIGEEIRNLGLEGQLSKRGTPTMGGIIILASILVPTLLFANLTNIYIILMIITTVWLGFVGWIDDYIKVFKKNKEGLESKFKLAGQIVLGLIVGVTLWYSNDVVIREKVVRPVTVQVGDSISRKIEVSYYREVKSTKTTIPFVKNHEFNYRDLVSFAHEHAEWLKWFVYVLAIIFIITAVSNGANITDGLDGLATGTSAIIGATLGILAYVSGNAIFSDYLNIMYIPNSGELVVFASAFMGATIGFLWYNSYPAQVFMGDTGSLALGGIIAVFAIVIRKELLIPILCGIFLVENLSVMLQVSYFKYTKRKYGEGRRIFLMAPLHHHYQKKGYPETKIVTRFWIVGFLLAVITIVTLKIR
ncbi:MAG: phospho-N-acetylmuramoyl-pentapeptide-transferase [Bacteroidales bacterium]|nr:phospho-N-acetylmuramoyl-pentapeptide-transferase [Bacteroidales bacterium]